jgi:Zn-dependent protease
MRATLPLGRINGVPIGAHWSALLGVALLGLLLALTVLPVLVPGQAPVAYFAAGVLGAVTLVLSLLAHELGHALVAQRAGLGGSGSPSGCWVGCRNSPHSRNGPPPRCASRWWVPW